jgi:hypothetical protein
MPRIASGGKKSAKEAADIPAKRPREPAAAATGPRRIGVAAMYTPAATKRAAKRPGDGRRSAQRPPSQYPAARAARVTAMSADQRKISTPKKGPMILVPRISTASTEAPLTEIAT